MSTNTEIPAVLLERLMQSDLQGLFKLELRGDDGGVWYVRLGERLEVLEQIEEGEHPDAIVRTDRYSIEALIAGKMTVSDGLVSERLSLVGDVTKLVDIKRALTGNRAGV